jgi:signal peptidase I
METSNEVGHTSLLEVEAPSRTEPIYLGEELGLDLWVKANTSRPQSLLIRSTTPDGKIQSAFMHIDGVVEHIPIFNNPDPLVLQDKKRSAREFSWSDERPKKVRRGKTIVKGSALLLALIFFASAMTGILQIRVVLTGSMKPAINPGDMVIAASTKLVKPEVGKVVLYGARDLDGKVVTVWSHRIIAGSEKTGFTIKGDANAQPDIGTIAASDIQSVVITRLPFIGRIFNIYSLIMIFSGLGIISFITSRGKRER